MPLEFAAFVSRYNYNMIEQSFMERRPERGAKLLNTMNITTISASLRQHGLGIVSTAVNICYKLLAKVRRIQQLFSLKIFLP
jgi:WASH complex subunit 7